MENYKKSNRSRLNRNNQESAAKGRDGEHVSNHLKRYRNEHGIDDLSEHLARNGIAISSKTLAHYLAGTRLPKTNECIQLARLLNVPLDEFILGTSTKNVDACNRTGLSNQSVENLSQIKAAHNKHPADQPYLLPVLDAILSDKEFLWELGHRASRLVYWGVENAGTPNEGIDFDTKDGIEYAMSRRFLDVVKSCIDAIIPIEIKKANRKELESMVTAALASTQNSLEENLS